jgi:hypothetical protein
VVVAEAAMSAKQVIGLAEGAIETVVPEARLVKPILYLIGGLLAIGAIWLAYWLLIGRAHHAEVKAATAHVEAITSKATAGAAQDAVKIITLHDKEVDHIQTITQGGVHAVQTAADAGTPVPAVAASMRASLCMFGTYRADPGCATVPGNGESVGPAKPDTGGASPR